MNYNEFTKNALRTMDAELSNKDAISMLCMGLAGERTNLYNLEIELVAGSPDDLKFKEFFKKRSKYKMSINIELKENEAK